MSEAPQVRPAWWRTFKPAPAAPVRLACLPHAGGSASFYHPLARALAPGIEVLAAQYPGRQDRYREPLVTSLTDLARHCFEALRPSIDRPLILFGHSMGALLAYEIALLMQDDGLAPPVHLVVSGRRAPSRYRDDQFHRLPPAGLVAQVRALSGTDASVLSDPETLRLILPAVRGDYRAVETYRHQPGRVVHSPVTALTGTDDPMVTVEEVTAWERHTDGPADIRSMPGGHFFVADHFDEIAALLRTIAVG
ncbi:thioesterase II family protein [Actinoplanes sp. N902-109]|uniref:thioesterase II family protein n=1 Tax=Actinoplanes sp. (strain N902-109) TaxID=649831 RepID=UPI000329666A|nr:alpha/beta fold hydrolase [Actinoplanes sp. N902-109]AGL19210.1 oleoyl-(acyl-carrier-protein) hydrolase [Actinoplanes sp. N902-109]